jgi:hypothetical protein
MPDVAVSRDILFFVGVRTRGGGRMTSNYFSFFNLNYKYKDGTGLPCARKKKKSR